jgi:aminoglycoside N3'-acetyltransferase
MHTRKQIVAELRSSGVNGDDHLAVSVSLKSVGSVEGGPSGLVDALIEAVGSRGTLMMTSFTRLYSPAELHLRKRHCVFDRDRTGSYTGIVAETLRARPGTVRSAHPSNSIIAVGAAAHYLTENHDEESPAYAPYSRLASLEGKVLSIGIGDNLIGIRHQAQYLAGLLDLVESGWGVYCPGKAGGQILFRRREHTGCVTKLPLLVKEMRESGAIIDGRVGDAATICAHAREALEYMSSRLKSAPEEFLCNRSACIWCREVERKLNLYPRIRNPAWYQGTGLGRTLVRYRNALYSQLQGSSLNVLRHGIARLARS